jgi:1-phosphatidylinositol-4-phosphate 5-kinase
MKTLKKLKTTEGKLVFCGHESWNLVLNMMIGIQKATRSCSDPGTVELTNHDFKMQYQFDLIQRRTGSEKEKHLIYKFIDYAPSAFMNIRK